MIGRVCQTLRLPNKGVFKGCLVLVNKAHPLWCAVHPQTLTEVEQGILMERKAAALLGSLLQAVDAEDEIVPVSGYRTRREQAKIFSGARAEYGEMYARTYVALPGCSEHQTGLAVDVAKKAENIDFITPEFPDVGVCATFRRKAAQYGFVERYPKGKESITGIGYEPWHFRYVGTPHAQLMNLMNFTLEEYLQWLKKFRCGQNDYLFQTEGGVYKIGYCPASGGETTDIELEEKPFTISGNNEAGFIVTVWQV